METNKLLALAQHLNIPFLKDDETYYFGVEKSGYNDYLDGINEDSATEYTGIEDWVINQDGYIDFENDVEVNGDYYTYEGEEYLILDNGEADTMAEQYAENLIEDCYLTKEIKESWIYRHFDMNSAIEEALSDGRGSLLATYDGEEREVTVDMETYYLYRTT